jgi:Putative Ig domain
MSRRFLIAGLPVVLLAVLWVSGCGGGGTQVLMVTTTTLPGGTVGTQYTPSLTATGGTPPYTWSQTSGGTMPPGVSFSNAGVFNGTPTTVGNYGPYIFTATDSASTAATANSVGLSISITSTNISVTTSSLPSGVVGTLYSATLLASGGNLPHTWSETSGGALPPGLSLAPSTGVISGTPTTSGSYGPYVFTVTDPSNASAASSNLTITISSAAAAVCTPQGNEAALQAGTPHAFLVKGTDFTGNPIDIAGSFTPDGNGGITAATADYNGFTNGPEQFGVKFSGSSYSLGANGQGCLYLAFSGPVVSSSNLRKAERTQTGRSAKLVRSKATGAKPELLASIPGVQFSFNLGAFDGTTYHSGRIIEVDISSIAGAITSGFLYVQDSSAFAISSLKSNYAFGVDGWTSSVSGYLRTALAGSFTNASGALSAGYADLNTGGTPSGELGSQTPGSGTLNSSLDTTTGRGTGSYTIPLTPNPGSLTLDFAFYILNASDIVILSTDSPSSVGSAPLFAGRALASNANYSSAALNGYYLLAAKGFTGTANASDNQVEIGTMHATGGSVPTANVYTNSAGIYTTSNYTNASYSIESASGRAAFSGLSSTSPVVYLTSTGTNDDAIVGFLVGTDTSVSTGELLLQSTSAPNFSASSISGSFIGGSDEDVDGLNGAYLGLFNFNAAGTYTTTSQVIGTIAVAPANGSFAINSDGSGNLNNGSLALVTNGKQIFAVPETNDPQLFVIFSGSN